MENKIAAAAAAAYKREQPDSSCQELANEFDMPKLTVHA